MADTDFPSDHLNEFDELDEIINFEALESSKRAAVRYRRDDIEATLQQRKLFSKNLFAVNLLNISSKGVAIISDHTLNKNSKVKLKLIFKDGRIFEIDAIVARIASATVYGLRFDRMNTLLADHLLETQTDLLFS